MKRHHGERVGQSALLAGLILAGCGGDAGAVKGGSGSGSGRQGGGGEDTGAASSSGADDGSGVASGAGGEGAGGSSTCHYNVIRARRSGK
jgi:hypothetical protein